MKHNWLKACQMTAGWNDWVLGQGQLVCVLLPALCQSSAVVHWKLQSAWGPTVFPYRHLRWAIGQAAGWWAGHVPDTVGTSQCCEHSELHQTLWRELGNRKRERNCSLSGQCDISIVQLLHFDLFVYGIKGQTKILICDSSVVMSLLSPQKSPAGSIWLFRRSYMSVCCVPCALISLLKKQLFWHLTQKGYLKAT